MQRHSLSLAVGIIALLVSFSLPQTYAQVVPQDSGAAQAVNSAQPDAADPVKRVGRTESPTPPAVSVAKLSPAAPLAAQPPPNSNSSAGKDSGKPNATAPQNNNGQEERKPLTKRLENTRKGYTVQYPEDWSVGPKRFANMDELINLSPEQVGKKPITAKIKITTEERRSHEEALRRLEEIRSGIGAPTSAFLTIGGWPAIQYGRPDERPSPGQFPRPQFKDKKMFRITTAIAVGDLLVQLEAILPSDASPGLIHQAEAISRSTFFSAKANPKKTQDEVGRLRKNARPRSAPLAIIAGDQVAAFTPLPASLRPTTSGAGGGAAKVLPAGGQDPDNSAEPGLTRRVITNRNGELEIAVSPNGRNIIIGQQSAFRSSTDGGQTFPFNGTIPYTGGDPSLAWGPSNAFYYAGIAGGGGCQAADAAGPQGYTCTGMARSTDNGQTFPFVTPAVACPNDTNPASIAGACFPDQEHIAADRVSTGAGGGDRVYSTWRNFDATDQDPGLVCSQDSGQTWSAPIVVGSGSFPRINVGQDGFVYVVYRSGSDYMLNKYNPCPAAGAPTVVPGFPVVVVAQNEITCPFPGHDRCDQDPSSQMLAVDDTNPNHVYFSVAVNGGSATNDNIIVRDSLDGGLTWPAGRVVQANDSIPGKRIMPWICTTGGEAFVTWYDRRAAPANQNDLTEYYAGRVRLDGASNLVVGSEIKLSEVGDPWCASGWPCGTRGAPGASEQCSVQPQLAGFCCSSLDANGNCVGSGNRCDFSDGCTIGGETCQGIGGGCPKYGDYNGNACAAGRIFAAYASATSPPSITPASTGIDIFFTSKLVGDVPQLQVPGGVNFGDICVGGTGTQTLNVCNTGKADLEINNITSNNPRFAVTTTTQGYPVVISHDFCFPFQVTFNPTATGAQTATLTITSNDPALPTATVQATGSGTRQAIDTLIPNSGNFGQVCVGSFKDLNLTINNSGGCDLVVNSVTSTGADASQFIVAGDNTYPITVAPGVSVQVPIRFQPTSIGNKAATIRVNSNDPNAPNKDVAVSGTSDPGDIRVTGSTNFGDICGGSVAEKTVNICNVATACNLNVTNVRLAANPDGTGSCSDFTLVNNPFPTPVSHDSCLDLVIRFTPTSAGPKQCTLVVESDDPQTPSVKTLVTANTPLASIDVSPDQSFLPEVNQSIGFCTTLQPFPISNKGICPVKVTDVSVNDPNNFGLSALPSFPINLQPGHTVGDGALKTVFKPIAPLDRERDGVLSVTYESDPIAHVLTTETRDLCGEVVNTGARVLVRVGLVPFNGEVESIRLNRINANRNKNNVDTVDNARNLPLQTFAYPAGSACTPFQYHREYGTVGNPIQLLPGSYTVTATAVINGKRKTKTVAFDVATCDFNPTIFVDF